MHLGVPDVGPGIHTVVQQIVSEVLDVPMQRVNVRVEDTDNSPFDSGTGGSKSTNSVGTAAYQAVSEIKEKIVASAAVRLGCKAEDLQAVNGRFAVPGQKPMQFADLMRLAVEENHGAITHLSVYEPSRAAITSFAAQVAEVEVDPGTGQVKVKKLTTVHDSGTVLNHLSYQGQIDGGVVTGLGFALMEDNSLIDGKMATANLGEFKMATIADVPKLTTVLMQDATRPHSLSGQSHRRNSQRPDCGCDRQRHSRRRRSALVRSAAHVGENLWGAVRAKREDYLDPFAGSREKLMSSESRPNTDHAGTNHSEGTGHFRFVFTDHFGNDSDF